MEEGFSRRLFLPDVRGEERYLRVTWHRDSSTIVFSHWRGDVCVASTPISLNDASRLIGLVVGALKDAAAYPATTQAQRPADAAIAAPGVLGFLRRRLRPQIAQVVRLPERRREAGSKEKHEGT